jgi:hypothetical protein
MRFNHTKNVRQHEKAHRFTARKHVGLVRQIMKNTRNKFRILTALVAGSTLALTLATPVNAAGGPSVSMTRMNERIAKLPELAGVSAGGLVTIHDDASVTGFTWHGDYAYYPAGSQIPLSDMYVRWKDGVVAVRMYADPTESASELNKDVARPFATYMEQIYGTSVNSNGDKVIAAVSQHQVTKRLVQDDNDNAIWRIPNNAFLFRDAGNGKVTTLVDAFVFKSGGAPVKRVSTASSNELEEHGAQPVGVMHQ